MTLRTWSARRHCLVAAAACLLASGCSDEKSSEPEVLSPPTPVCEKNITIRVDSKTPASMVADWGTPVRLGDPVNTLCPQDAIEITRDGAYLFVMYTEDVLGNMTPAEILERHNNTYRLERIGGPDEFGEPEYYDLGKGTSQSFSGEISFSPDGGTVYFHSLRSSNLGYQQQPPMDDFLDIYEADIVDGVPGSGRNLGPPVNSVYPDGEHAIHPDGVTLYFASRRPGGSGGADIYTSVFDGDTWSDPVNLGWPINSIFDDYQPAFSADGDTMYYTSGRNPLIGNAIYRSVRAGGVWGAPELVVSGLVGEPSLTGDGGLLYFVHVLSDADGNYDADVWFCRRVR